MFLFLKRNIFKLILILILLIMLVYTVNITTIPKSIILFENEGFNIKPILGLKLEQTMPVDAKISKQGEYNIQTSKDEKKVKSETNDLQQIQYNLSLFGLNLKTITANIVKNKKVIPIGNLIGLKLYTEGVLVVGMSEVKGEDNKIYKPYENTGIEQGDSILEINNVEVNTTEELIACVSRCKGEEIEITYLKDANILETKITPIKTGNNIYKMGLWVRDAEAGIGTMTFLDASNNTFVALGHGIQDIDTEELVEITSGELITSDILKIEKGEKGKPGKIQGSIENSRKIGEIYGNTQFGIYGVSTNNNELNISNIQEVEVASRNEIKTGKATIICTLEDGIRKEYEIEIEKIYINNNENNKSMLVKITDKELLEKTGGIIQGMSGSPILQDGKLIGALTHVLVQNPTTGYGVFADIMLQQLM